MSQPAPPPASPPSKREPNRTARVQNHQVLDWSSGSRGGGKVPDDFGWTTNPKQYQEENGNAVSGPVTPAK